MIVRDFSTKSEFTYYPSSLRVAAVTPSVGSCGADIRIKLEHDAAGGDAFVDAIKRESVVVKFGGGGGVGDSGASSLCVAELADAESATVVCSIPVLRPGRHHVSASVNGQQFSPVADAAFVSHHTPHTYNAVPARGPSAGGRVIDVAIFFFSFSPRTGPASGGTRVVVKGHGMSDGHAFKCRFGGRVVSAARVRAPNGTTTTGGEVTLECVAPPSGHGTWEPRDVEFSVSVDGRHFTAGGGCDSTFTYYVDPKSVASGLADATDRWAGIRMFPTHGPVAGGELVRIEGLGHLFDGRRGFDAGLRCRFGRYQMRALLDVADASLKCLTPPHEVGTAQVAVSVNGGADYFSSELGLSYRFWRDPATVARKGQFVLWPLGGAEVGGTTVTVLGHALMMTTPDVSKTKAKDLLCHFGDGATPVPATILSEDAGGVLTCVTPPLEPYAPGGGVRFGLSRPGSGPIVWDAEPSRWTWFPRAAPLHMSPAAGDARGGVEIHIRGANMTRSKAWLVRFGDQAQVRGIWDGGRSVVVALSPPLEPGVWPVRISEDGGRVWTDVPGRFLAMETARLFVFGSPGSTGAGSSVELVYLPVSLHRDDDDDATDDDDANRTRISSALFSSIEIAVEGFPPVRLQERDDDSGEWYAILHVHERLDVAISTVRVKFAERTHGEISSTNSSILPSLDVVRPSNSTVRLVDSPAVLSDDNAGRGWHWHRRSAMKTQWRLSPQHALRGGRLWNEMDGVRVSFDGGSWQEAVKGRVDVTHDEIRVRCKSPKAPKGFEGVATVRVSLEGASDNADDKDADRKRTDGFARFSLEDTTPQHVFDSRYATPSTGLNFTYLRISPGTAAMAGQTVPKSILGRKLFDERVVYDIGGSIGVSRDRIVVVGVDGDSGVFSVECVRSKVPADPTCDDLMHELRRQAAKPTSVLYDGIVTWALDPLFPNAEAVLDPSTGLAHVKGVCSDPRFFSEKTCLAAGRCQCNIGPDREGENVRERCEASFFPSGQPCRFVPYSLWSDDGVMSVTFGKCSDPKKRTKKACLSAGTCSDPKFKTREACLEDGACGAPPERKDHDFSQYLTRDECEDPKMRAGGGGAPTGHCTALPTAKGKELRYDYAQFKNRAHCEKPKSRPKVDAPKKDTIGTQTECGLCVQGSSDPENEPFTYAQFKTKETCENPESRPLPVVGACAMPGPSGFRGGVRTGKGKDTDKTQYDGEKDPGLCLPIFEIEYPSAFNCRHITDQGKGPCEKPELRNTTACTTSLFGATMEHCYKRKNGTTKKVQWWSQLNPGGYPDLRIPHGRGVFANRSDPEIMNGPPCRWSPLGEVFPNVPSMKDPSDWMADCGQGPKGEWDPSKDPLGRSSDDPTCGKGDDGIPPPGPPGKWIPGEIPDLDLGLPGTWFALNQFNPDNKWTPGPDEQPTCPCNWQAKLWHLTKCNWKTCGPSKKGTPGGVVDFVRLKGPNEYVSDYQAYVMVGGGTMWMTLETGVATSWVMSMACFTSGCKKTKTYIGMFIPAMPPLFTPIDMFERGLLQLGAMLGMFGHTMMSVAGFFSFGTPFVMGLLDIGDIIGESSYNHTGAIGLAFWEDNMAHYLTVMDPMSDLITFMKTGNIFFPIPGTPALIMKPFQIWGIPWMFPTGLVFNFAFYFADAGGCFFMEASGSSGHLTMGGMKWLMVIPIALKLLVPSWLFVLSSIRIRGQSIPPCFFGACKATVHTGQFHISGPVTPVLMILEECGAPKTCELIETLPDISFTLSGSTFTMTHQQYVIESEAYGEKECLTAFTPVFQLIPGFGMWIFGDAWVHAFYTKFEVIPMKRVGFAISDGRYYEKNACTGKGIGPMGSTKPMKQEQKDRKKQMGKLGFEFGTNAAADAMGWKRYDNWMRDLQGKKKVNAADDVLKNPCPSSFRFREGACVPMKMREQAEAVSTYHDERRRAVEITSGRRDNTRSRREIEADVSMPRELTMELFNRDYASDGTSAAERFFMGGGGDGFMHDPADVADDDHAATAFIEEVGDDREREAMDEADVLRREKEWERRAFHRTLPKNADLRDFRRKRTEKMRDADRRFEEARQDRIRNGVEPDMMRFKRTAASTTIKTATGASHERMHIELPTEAVTDEATRKEMYRNMSAILRNMEPELNVTRVQTRSWWRGESEDYIEKERLRQIAEWEKQLVVARRMARSFKVKSAINKRVLRRVAEKMTKTNAQLERALWEEEERTRVGGEWNAWDHASYHNASADLFLKAAKMYNITHEDEDAIRADAERARAAERAKENARVKRSIESLKRQLKIKEDRLRRPATTTTNSTTNETHLRWRPPPNKKEQDFLRMTRESKGPVLEIIRDPETGEWREEVYVPPSVASDGKKNTTTTTKSDDATAHDPHDVLNLYEVRERLWRDHHRKVEEKHADMEKKLRDARTSTEATRRHRLRQQRRRREDTLQPGDEGGDREGA